MLYIDNEGRRQAPPAELTDAGRGWIEWPVPSPAEPGSTAATHEDVAGSWHRAVGRASLYTFSWPLPTPLV